MGGVVHQHIDPPRFVGRVFHGTVDIILVCNICVCKLGSAARVAYTAGCGFTGFAINVGNKYPGSLFREEFCDCAADAVGGASYDRHFVRESGHHSSVVWSLRWFANGWLQCPM